MYPPLPSNLAAVCVPKDTKLRDDITAYLRSGSRIPLFLLGLGRSRAVEQAYLEAQAKRARKAKA